MGEENIKLYLFADDTKIYCHVKNLTEEDNLQRGIENLVDWTNRWQVSLNINKCKIMSVHHRKYFQMAASQLVTQSSRHTISSSHG